MDAEYAAHECYPPYDRIFDAFRLTPFETVKVVILGQDPYHEPGQAQGLAFYVPPEVKVPPSLVNIAKELQAERTGEDARKMSAKGLPIPDLRDWARQGVLLLNDVLTVRGGHDGALSHQRRGWERFTDAAVRMLDERREHLVFMLWGAHAERKGAAIDRQRHLVIESAHPSPLSARRGFFGSHPFAKANEYLSANGIEGIRW